MADYQPYSNVTCNESIKNFQERLVEADNLKKDKDGNLDFESSWKAMRKEGPMILNVAKHLFANHLRNEESARKDQGVITAPMMEME